MTTDRRTLLRSAMATLAERIPEGWRLAVEEDVRQGRLALDAVATISAPDGTAADFIVGCKPRLESRDVADVRDQLNRDLDSTGTLAQGAIAVAPYLSSSVRSRLSSAGISYVDATGNLRVESVAPGLFLADRGADADPQRGPGRPRESLRGEPAAKVVRALTDLAGPWRPTELAAAAGSSVGSMYRVLELLQAEELVRRDASGGIVVEDWVGVLRRWSDDYGFGTVNTVSRWIAPRGLPRLMDSMRSSSDVSYAVTGSLAASAWAAYAPARSAMVYVDDADAAAERWGLRRAETGNNVVLARPAYPVVFERTVSALDGLVVAAPTQVAVDLLTGPGRSPSEGEELLTWMKENESAWRR